MKSVLAAELLKLKRSKLIFLAIFMPLFSVCQGIGNFIRYYDLFTSKGQDIWQQLVIQSSIFYYMTLLPVLVILVMILLVKMENDNNYLRQYLSLPIKKSHIYFSKLFIGMGLVFLNILVFIVSLIIGGSFLAKTPISFNLVVFKPLLAFIALLSVMGIQYYLSMRFHHLAIPLGIGLLFSLPAIFNS